MSYRKRIPRDLLPRDWYDVEWKRDVMTRGEVRLLKLRGEKFDGIELGDLLVSYPTIHIRTLSYYLSVQDFTPSVLYTLNAVSLGRVDVFELMTRRGIIKASNADYIVNIARICVHKNSFDIIRCLAKKYAPYVMTRRSFHFRIFDHLKYYTNSQKNTVLRIIKKEWREPRYT